MNYTIQLIEELKVAPFSTGYDIIEFKDICHAPTAQELGKKLHDFANKFLDAVDGLPQRRTLLIWAEGKLIHEFQRIYKGK